MICPGKPRSCSQAIRTAVAMPRSVMARLDSPEI